MLPLCRSFGLQGDHLREFGPRPARYDGQNGENRLGRRTHRPAGPDRGRNAGARGRGAGPPDRRSGAG
ncbi:MAG: hypothetical protein GC186_08265 [Rhodobacteraceae bacterium]|nr:hypothetical protein [Paracoccaceae bacterium]